MCSLTTFSDINGEILDEVKIIDRTITLKWRLAQKFGKNLSNTPLNIFIENGLDFFPKKTKLVNQTLGINKYIFEACCYWSEWF